MSSPDWDQIDTQLKNPCGAGKDFESPHYAFKDEAEFDGIFKRVRAEGIAYGSGPPALDDMKINHRRAGRGPVPPVLEKAKGSLLIHPH
jgi:hypothetical protein